MGSNVSNRDPSPPLQNFNIYKCIPSLRNFRHHITCIAAYDDHVLLGTKDGYILRGTLNDRLVLDSKLEVRPSRTRSPIVQIEVFPEFGIVISLSDKLISVCTLDFARIPFAVDKTCGATSFVTNGSNTETKNGNILKMCIVIGKKLMLFHWKQGNFHKLANDLPLREIPKAVAWFNDYICVCLDNEYTKIDYETGAKTELFTFGKQGPLLMPLEYRNELALGFGEETYLMRLNEETDSLSWENSPIAILDDIPYLVALSSESTIEVQTVEPRLLVQKIENPTSQPNCLKLLVKCANKKGRFFVASSSKVSEVYCLTPEPLSYQIEQFLGERHFHLALNLNDESDETQDSKYRRTKEIEYQHALDCVQHNDLINSLIIFQRINADPIQVLELYSPYLEASGTFSAPLHASNEKELQIIDSLIDYLIVIRESLRKYIKDRKLTNFWPDLDPKEISNKKETLEQILDTMLLQCYLKKG
ncbi:Vam6/Vps39-like protein [Halotydeus destructor]|nr:Vam6/Vps39-like protein [Halotydeus destructor]